MTLTIKYIYKSESRHYSYVQFEINISKHGDGYKDISSCSGLKHDDVGYIHLTLFTIKVYLNLTACTCK